MLYQNILSFLNVISGEAVSLHYTCQVKLPFDSVTDTLNVIKAVFMYFFLF